MQIRKASRQGVKPLIDLYSESGCGKTYSALLLARGFVGPSGKIGMIDSESGRGELYADVIPGGYDVLRLESPFSPARYIEAHDAIVASGATIGIIDSVSHEWEGIGGVLDMAGDSEAKSGRSGLHNWKVPKMEHAKFVLRLLQSPLPWIVCIRAKYKSRQIKGAQEMADDGVINRSQVGKTVILKDNHTSPIQSEEFIFEATAHAEILPDHSIHLTKCSHPSLRDCFPDKGPITSDHGRLLAEWCAQAGTTTPKTKAASSDLPKLKKELWNLTIGIHNKNAKALEQWLIDENCMSDTETLDGLTEPRIVQVIEKAKKKLMVPA